MAPRLKALPFLVLAVAWEVAARTALIDPAFFSSPSMLAGALYDWYASGKIVPHLWRTLFEIAMGVGLAFAIGVIAGVWFSWYTRLGAMATPSLVVLDAVPTVAFAPMIPLVTGTGPYTAIVLIFFLTLPPTVFSVMAGMRTLPQDLVRMARHFGAGEGQLFVTVVLPAITPYLVGALRVSIGRAMAGALVGEWMGSNLGLGSMMFDAAGAFEVRTVYVGALTALLVSVGLTGLVRVADNRVSAWRVA